MIDSGKGTPFLCAYMSINKLQGMKRKVRACQNLGTVVKAQRLLWKCEQDRARFKRLYVSEAMEHEKAVRRLEKEKAFSCYLYDCREALLTRLYDVNSKCPQVDKVLEHYRKFDLMASKRLEEKVKAIIG